MMAVAMLVTLLPSFPISAFAVSESELSFSPAESEDSWYVSAASREISGELVIPSTHSGKPVTEIDYNGFAYCTQLTSVVIPDSITSVNSSAFSGCSALETITFLGSPSYISDDAFDETPWYQRLPDGPLYIGTILNSYKGLMPKNTRLTVREGTKSIGIGAIFPQGNLVALSIPESVEYFPVYAMNYCENLSEITIAAGNKAYCAENNVVFSKDRTSLLLVGAGLTGEYTVPAGVTHIGDKAFSLCTEITKINIPNSVSSLSGDCFLGCDSLMDINVSSGNPNYYSTDGVLFENDGKVLVALPGGRTGTYTIPEGTASMGYVALGENDKLLSVVVPDSMTSFNQLCGASYAVVLYCSADSPAKAYAKEENIFCCAGGVWYDKNGDVQSSDSQECTYGDGLVFSKYSDTYCLSSVNRCLESIVIPATVYGLPMNNTFYHDAFQNSDSLKSISVANGNEAFKAIDGVLFNADATELLYYPQAREGAYTIPQSVTKVDYAAFENARNLTELTVSGAIENRAYINNLNGCDSLIAIKAEQNDKNYSSVNGVLFSKDKSTLIKYPTGKSGAYSVPEGTEIIEGGAFASCGELTTLNIPKSIEQMEEYSWELFYGCNKLAEINVASDNENYASVDGVLFCLDKSRLIRCLPARAGVYTVPDGTVTIIEGAFRGCKLLTGVVLPESLKEIGNSAFSSCSSLETVSFNEGLEIISVSAFADCEKLSLSSLPSTLTSVDSYSFEGTAWYNAQPEGVVYLGDVALMKGELPQNSEVTIRNGTRVLANRIFSGISWDSTNNGISKITLPEGLEVIGWSAFEDCDALTSVDIPSTVRNIDSNAFYNCGNITEITIPQAVEYVGANAFVDCDKLKTVNYNATDCKTWGYFEDNMSMFYVAPVFADESSPSAIDTVNIGANVQTIPAYAFYLCREIESITFPEGIKEIGDGAFSGCVKISQIDLPNSLERLGSSFYNTAWYNAQPEGMVYLDGFAYDYKWLEDEPENLEITLNEGTKGVAGSAFSSLYGLKKITLPDSISSIGSWAFHNTALTEVDLPEGIKSIGPWAFYGCDGMVSVELPESIEFLGEYAIDAYTVIDCKNLAEVQELLDNFNLYCWYRTGGKLYDPEGTQVNPNSEIITDENGIFFRSLGYGTLEIIEMKGAGQLEVPEEFAGKQVTSIEYANTNPGLVKSVKIPRSVTSIYEYSFPSGADFTVYGYTGSQAQTYALERGNTFIALDAENKISSSEITVSQGFASGIIAGSTVEQTVQKLSNNAASLKVFDTQNVQVVNTSAKMGTGFVIKLYDGNNNVVDEVTVVVKGDLNGDGSAAAADARLALRCATSLETLNAAQNSAGSISGGAKPTAADARAILRVATGLESF